MESDKIIQNPRFVNNNTNTSSKPVIMPSNDLSQKQQQSSLLDRFRVLLKQKEEQARVSNQNGCDVIDDDGDVAGTALSSQEIVQLYELVLDELTFNSKPIITDLTIIAGELRDHGAGIADAICARIIEVPVDQKLPSLYLLDSIVKNIGRDYIRHFSPRLPEVFCEAYKQVHPNLYPSMRHLFKTWSTVFPPYVLSKIETQLQFSSQANNNSINTSSNQSSGLSSLKASDSPRTSNVIHVNPKYVRLDPSPSENNAQHVRGTSLNLEMFDKKPPIGYFDDDSDHVEISCSQVGPQRVNTVGTVGPSSFVLGPNKLHPSTSSRITRRLSPSRIGAERPLPSEVDDFSTGSSPQRFLEGASPSHPVLDYGPLRSIGRDEETNEWRRKLYSDDNHNRLEASIAYNLSNGHEHQGPRALIDAYGEDKRKRLPSKNLLQIERIDVDITANKAVSRSWQNTEEEEFDWEDMSPTLADRGRSNDLLPSVPPFRGAGARPGFGTRIASQLDSDIRINRSGHAQLPLVDDSSNITEDSLPLRGSGRGSGGKVPGFQADRSHIMGSRYPREAWKSPHQFPQSTDPLPSRMASSTGLSSTGVWPLVNVHKSHPPPVHPLPILPLQKQSRSQPDPRNVGNTAVSQGLLKSSFLSEQHFNVLESKEHSLTKQPLLRSQNQAQVNPFQPQFLQSNEAREYFPPSAASMPPHQVAPTFDFRYATQRIPVPSNPTSSMQLPLPANNIPNALHLQVGGRPPLPPGPPPPVSHMIPMPPNAGPVASNQPPGSAFSGLISSLMAQGLISLEKQAAVQDHVGLEFNADLLKVRHESAISSLYADLPRQCTTCGLRFRFQEEHSSHMDWHVTKNRMSKNRKQKPSRKWFVSASMWLSGAEALGTDAVPGFLPTEAFVDKKDDEEMAVPADEEQNACALCGEPFDDFYSDETEEWMYRGAVYLNAPSGSTAGMDRSQLGPIVHAKCRSESSVVPPEDIRSGEGADIGEASQRKRMRS